MTIIPRSRLFRPLPLLAALGLLTALCVAATPAQDLDPRLKETEEKRVAVIDADTGKMKRYWGAYGNKPDDANLGPYDPSAPPAQQFRNPVHCVERSNDGLVYVCDRQNDRMQVFTPEGKFVKEGFYAKNTKGAGSVWDITFSKDPQQRRSRHYSAGAFRLRVASSISRPSRAAAGFASPASAAPPGSHRPSSRHQVRPR